MKKELITVSNIESFICRQDGRLYVDQNRILTPGAKDELARRKVCVVYGPEPAPVAPAAPAAAAQPDASACRSGCCCGAGKTYYIGPEEGLTRAGSIESLARTVASMLKSQYGVTDPEQIRAMTAEALKTIKDNV